MKFRSGLLVACMIVVPMLAMFSHHVPDGVVAAASRLVYDPMVSRLSAALSPRVAGGNGTDQDAPLPTAGATPGPAEGPAAVTVPPVRSESSGLAASVAAAATPQAPAPRAEAGNAGPAVARLAALGALSIDCRPMPGVAGRHRASCRMPVDVEGQLHRVFQATGTDRAAAEQNLLEDVLATWRHAPR